MIDSAFQLLFRYEQPLNQRQIMLSLGMTPREMDDLLKALAKDDRILTLDAEEEENTQFQVAPLDTLIADQDLKDVTFVITDLESTGAIKGKDRIIDIAAQKIKNGKVVGEFECLVNPQQKIPHQITRLTGIKNDMVKDADSIEVVLPKFLEFAKDCVFVAHNALFDFAFINFETRRLGLPALPNKVEICTFRMAKKLLPQLRACGVSGLSAHFGYEMKDRHRAMPDVKATKFFLDEFITQLGEQGITTLYQLIDFQKEVISSNALHKKIKKFLKKQEYLKKKKTHLSST